MAPNLYLALRHLTTPSHWFCTPSTKDSAPSSTMTKPTRPLLPSPKHSHQSFDFDFNKPQYSSHPVPGLYKCLPGCGWFLVATRDDEQIPTSDAPRQSTGPMKTKPKRSAYAYTSASSNTYTQLANPIAVTYSPIHKHFLFTSDFNVRKRKGKVVGEPRFVKACGFFKLDDGVTWVKCWDSDGGLRKGPWERYCWEVNGEGVGGFRLMRLGDLRFGSEDERWREKREKAPRAGRCARDESKMRDGGGERSDAVSFREMTKADDVLRGDTAGPLSMATTAVASSPSYSRSDSGIESGEADEEVVPSKVDPELELHQDMDAATSPGSWRSKQEARNVADADLSERLSRCLGADTLDRV